MAVPWVLPDYTFSKIAFSLTLFDNAVIRSCSACVNAARGNRGLSLRNRMDEQLVLHALDFTAGNSLLSGFHCFVIISAHLMWAERVIYGIRIWRRDGFR